jgi:MATE family multidrug resistance protein
MVLVYTVVYALAGEYIASLLTNETQVLAALHDYIWWACLIPVCGALAFMWDGVYIGITATRGMLYSLAVAAAAFFISYFAFVGSLANHALWLAQLLYLLTRGLFQTIWWKKAKYM